jgi:restriction endonuclease S subunit
LLGYGSALVQKSGTERTTTGTIPEMRNIKVPDPALSDQRKFVAKIEALEKQITEAQSVIDSAAARKQAILKNYL